MLSIPMRTRNQMLSFCSLLFVAAWAAFPVAGGEAVFTVNVGQNKVAVNPLLYGIFLEDINHTVEGGIYAELIRDRSFESTADPCAERTSYLPDNLHPKSEKTAWSLVNSGMAQGTMVFDSAPPLLNSAQQRCCRLDIAAIGPGERVAIANEGFWGINIKEGAKYDFSLYARGDEKLRGNMLVVSLEDEQGFVYASQEIGPLTTVWQRFGGSLRPTQNNPKGRFLIAAQAPGTIWLDVVSLFPPTWKQRPNGLRPELAELIAELKPAFCRFPGGAFVHSGDLPNAWRWKKTIGDIAERPGHWNLWGYRSSDGLGLHEYLQLCEDLGTEPLLVIPLGVTGPNNSYTAPMSQVGEWLQDALDAVEYANGPATSKWGALRAQQGHPAPFNVKFLGLDNERGGREYNERYKLFYEAIKKQYPSLTLVSPADVGKLPCDIRDEHYYGTLTFFQGNDHRFDNYPRGGPRISVSEYAGGPNLAGALAEGLFLLGLERNSDLMTLCCDAPLCTHLDDAKWRGVCIEYDNYRSYRQVPFYIQKLFSRNRGDYVLKSTLDCDKTALEQGERGKVGVETEATRVELQDVQVVGPDGRVLYKSDFGRGAPEWRVEHVPPSCWVVRSNSFCQVCEQSDQRLTRVTTGETNWTDYTYFLKFRKTGGENGVRVLFRFTEHENWLSFNVGGWGNSGSGFEAQSPLQRKLLSPMVPGKVETGKWYDVKVEVQADAARGYLNGQLIAEARLLPPIQLDTVYAGANQESQNGDVILKMINVQREPQRMRIRLNGTAFINPSARETVLSSAELTDANSLDHPFKVAPVEQTVTGIEKDFGYSLAPYSLTVLRINTKAHGGGKWGNLHAADPFPVGTSMPD